MLPFPPFTHPPRWVMVSPPCAEDISALQLIVTATLEQLAILQTILHIRPSPGHSRLRRISHKPILMEEVLDALRSIECPASLISWLDTGRTLARQASEDIDHCFQALDKVMLATPDHYIHQQYLEYAQQAARRAYQRSEALHHHLQQYVQEQAANDQAPDEMLDDRQSQHEPVLIAEGDLRESSARITNMEDWLQRHQ